MLKQITENFGRFIPTEVILGGRVCFEVHEMLAGYSTENSNRFGARIGSSLVETESGYSFSLSGRNSRSCRYEYKNLIGGRQPEGLKYFDEEAWVKTLANYRDWDCIEFRNPISIFKLLPDYLRKQINTSLGKKILYSSTKDLIYRLDKNRKATVFELKNIPQYISNIIQNKEADCNVFATVIDTERTRNDFFNCHIFYTPGEKPKVMIHCIPKKFKERAYKLKISWMIIGYDIDFIISNSSFQLEVLKSEFDSSKNQTIISAESIRYQEGGEVVPICLGIPVLRKLSDSLIVGHYFFDAKESNKIGRCAFSYCLKKKRYVKLPDFTLWILKISGLSASDDSGLIPFKRSLIGRKTHVTLDECDGKYISLYFTERIHHGPIFLKRNPKTVRTKYIYCKCNNNCPICRNRIEMVVKNTKCFYFDIR